MMLRGFLAAAVLLAVPSQLLAETLTVTISNVEVIADPKSGQPILSLILTPQSKIAIADFTRARIGEQVKMRLGDTVLSEPFILEPITEGRLAITGNFTDASARALADLLAKSGGMFEVDGSDK